MIVVRAARTPADLEAWSEVKSRVEPDDPITPMQLERHPTPDRALFVAELSGRVVGAGGAGRSTLGGLAFVNARVLPESRGRGSAVPSWEASSIMRGLSTSMGSSRT